MRAELNLIEDENVSTTIFSNFRIIVSCYRVLRKRARLLLTLINSFSLFSLLALFAIAARWMRFRKEVKSVSKHTDHLEVSVLSSDRQWRGFVREIGASRYTGVLQSG